MLLDQTTVLDGFPYMVAGVLVSSAAIGTPVNLDWPLGSFGDALGSWVGILTSVKREFPLVVPHQFSAL